MDTYNSGVKVRHLGCGTMRPFGGRLVDGAAGLLRPARMVCHVLVVETDDGLLLVDTGFGAADLVRPPATLPAASVRLFRPAPDPAMAAVNQVRAMGHDPADVKHVVLTHMDLDHAGGLPDFPHATVHVFAPEHAAAMARATAGERQRYRPGQWAHGPKWCLHGPTPDREWFGLPAIAGSEGLPDDVVLVPLTGHSRGHAGVAVRADEGWLLHAGDVYFHHREMAPTPSVPPLLGLFERAAQFDGRARMASQRTLRTLIRDHGDEVTVFSAHDAVELQQWQV